MNITKEERSRLITSVRYRYNLKKPEAEDAVQEACMKILSKGLTYSPGLVYRTAVNLIIEKIRRDKIFSRIHPLILTEIKTETSSLEEVLENTQALSAITNSLACLKKEKPQLYQALSLHYFENLPWAEVASRLKIGIRAAQFRVSHALEFLEGAKCG